MIIIHRCSCGHPDIAHRGGGNSCESCSARNHVRGPAELLPTYVDGRVQEFVHEPGSSWCWGITLCGCADCRALYAEVKVDVEPLRPWYYRDPQPAAPKKRTAKKGVPA